MHTPVVALISADSSSKTVLEEAVSERSTTLLTATTTEAGLRLLSQRRDLTLIVCDDSEGRIARASVLAQARQAVPPIPVVVLGQWDSAKAALEAVREGATDYLPKPLSVDAIKSTLLSAQTNHTLIAPDTSDRPLAFEQIVSISPQMQLVKHLAQEVARTDATVLITGESGTGKELFAHAIHAASPRSKGPFIALNCAGIPEHLLESELFGYQRGAFT